MTAKDDVPYTHDDGVGMSGEKDMKPKDSDNSSGNIENVEQATGGDVEVVDRARERAILRKLDYRIVPMVMWCYLMNMMDRGAS